MSCHIILVCTNDCAFKFVTCSSADGVRNVAANSVGIRAARHGDEQMIGLNQLDFVVAKQSSIVIDTTARSLPLSNVFLKMMSVIFIWVVPSVLRVDVDFSNECLTVCVDFVS